MRHNLIKRLKEEWAQLDPVDPLRGVLSDAIDALAKQSAQPSKPWVHATTWRGLTDEEIEQVCVPLGAAMLSFTEVARAIEAKLREKNT